LCGGWRFSGNVFSASPHESEFRRSHGSPNVRATKLSGASKMSRVEFSVSQIKNIVLKIQRGETLKAACDSEGLDRHQIGYFRKRNPEINEIIEDAIEIRLERKVQRICDVISLGGTITEAIKAVGISQKCFVLWRQKYNWAEAAFQFARKQAEERKNSASTKQRRGSPSINPITIPPNQNGNDYPTSVST
jgi:hypothetical protein